MTFTDHQFCVDQEVGTALADVQPVDGQQIPARLQQGDQWAEVCVGKLHGLGVAVACARRR